MAPGTLKRGLVGLHKWLGAALSLFFAMWFASGMVMYFVPFPALTEHERLQALPLLQTGGNCCLDVAEAARRADMQAYQSRLGMLGDRQVWRVLATPSGAPAEPALWRALDARTGAVLPPLSPAQAALLAETFSGRAATAVEALDRDQWTVPQGLDAYRPLFKVSLGAGPEGDDGLQLYVSSRSAEVVRDTRRAERFWNWLGAVPHWIYPTVLRQFPSRWHQVVVWLSVLGVVAVGTGLALGIWQLFLNRSRWIPYRKFWMRWHHMLGLGAGAFALTWMFSGLLSMNPFGVFTPRVPGLDERHRWQGMDSPFRTSVADAIAAARQQGLHAVELEPLRVGGQSWYRLRDATRQWLVRADVPSGVEASNRLPDRLMENTLSGLRLQPPDQLVQLNAYDELYYARRPAAANPWQRPLPVWRATWADGETVYADPGSGRILMRADQRSRWQRVLYNGLHSFDFAPLLARPRLRDALVLGLSALGLTMSVTACVLAWRVLVGSRSMHPRQRASRAHRETEHA